MTKVVVLTEDEYNDLKIDAKCAMIDLQNLPESYFTIRISNRLQSVLDTLNGKKGEQTDEHNNR